MSLSIHLLPYHSVSLLPSVVPPSQVDCAHVSPGGPLMRRWSADATPTRMAPPRRRRLRSVLAHVAWCCRFQNVSTVASNSTDIRVNELGLIPPWRILEFFCSSSARYYGHCWPVQTTTCRLSPIVSFPVHFLHFICIFSSPCSVHVWRLCAPLGLNVRVCIQ